MATLSYNVTIMGLHSKHRRMLIIILTSSNGNIFGVTGLDVFFDLHQNKRLSKQYRHRWFETPSRSLSSHCNDSSPMRRTLYDCLWVTYMLRLSSVMHDDVIKWEHFPRHWPFVRGIHHKGQWCGALKFSLICVWMDDWVNNREAGDLRRHRAHYDFIVMGNWHRRMWIMSRLSVQIAPNWTRTP